MYYQPSETFFTLCLVDGVYQGLLPSNQECPGMTDLFYMISRHLSLRLERRSKKKLKRKRIWILILLPSLPILERIRILRRSSKKRVIVILLIVKIVIILMIIFILMMKRTLLMIWMKRSKKALLTRLLLWTLLMNGISLFYSSFR